MEPSYLPKGDAPTIAKWWFLDPEIHPPLLSPALSLSLFWASLLPTLSQGHRDAASTTIPPTPGTQRDHPHGLSPRDPVVRALQAAHSQPLGWGYKKVIWMHGRSGIGGHWEALGLLFWAFDCWILLAPEMKFWSDHPGPWFVGLEGLGLLY